MGFVLALAAASNASAAAGAYPGPESIASAHQYLSGRSGSVSFAVVDSDGKLSGVNVHRSYLTASVVKGMILVGFLRELNSQHRGLSGSDKATLSAMIRVSDNNAATTIWQRVGDPKLRRLAHMAKMRNFHVSGFWLTARTSAADQARYFLNMDHLVPPKFRGYARSLLSSIDPSQSWGIPSVARPRGWHVFFKGGWLPKTAGLVNQVARLEQKKTHIAIAVMTEGDPSMGYGEETIAGVAERLLRGQPSAPTPPPTAPAARGTRRIAATARVRDSSRRVKASLRACCRTTSGSLHTVARAADDLLQDALDGSYGAVIAPTFRVASWRGLMLAGWSQAPA